MNKRRASITIEAALIMPLVILSMAFVYQFIQIQYLDYRLAKALTESSLNFSYDSYFLHQLEVPDTVAELTKQRQWMTPKKAQALVNQAKEIVVDVGQEGAGEQTSQSISQTVERAKEYFDFSQNIWKAVKELPSDIQKTALSEGSVLVSRSMFNRSIEKKINQKMADLSFYEPANLTMENSLYFYDKKGSVIVIDYIYYLPIRTLFATEVRLHHQLYVEGFFGNVERLDEKPASKSKSKSKSKDSIVYRTNQGTKYHTNSKCRHIYVPLQSFPANQMGKNKHLCEYCCQHTPFIKGNTVFKTTKSSIYHSTADCPKVYHQITTLPLKEALKKGYQLCKTCADEGGK